MAPPRKFDHDEARRLRAEGQTYAALAERFGVTTNAIYIVCNPAGRAAAYAASRRYHEHVCAYCGEKCSWNRFANLHHDVPRCHRCFALQQGSSAKPDVLHCWACKQWKPDDDFPMTGGPANQIARRGRHRQCRSCNTKARQAYRQRHKVPCACCGAPALPPNEKGPRGADFPRCRACHYARRVPEQASA